MKKTILILVAGFIAMGNANMLRAQTAYNGQPEFRSMTNEIRSMTNEIRSGGVNASPVGSGGPSAGTEAGAVKSARTFLQMFGDAKNEKWYPLPGGSLARFDEQGIAYRVVFNKKGNWVYTLKQYTEKELPAEIRARIKSTYYDYPIGWVKEVNQLQSIVYLIHIENDQEWKTIRVADGETEVAEHYYKTPAR
jgi:hypothetical protein